MQQINIFKNHLSQISIFIFITFDTTIDIQRRINNLFFIRTLKTNRHIK